MTANIRSTAIPKYIFFPVIFILDLAPVGSNSSVNWGCNSLVVIPRQVYLLDIKLFKTVWNSVDYVPKMIVRDLNNLSQLFVFCPPICAGRFSVTAACQSFPMLLMLMCGFLMLFTALLWSWFAFIKPVIVAAITDRFSVVIPIAIVFFLLLRVSMIFLSMAHFLPSLCCISWTAQSGSFNHPLLANNIFRSKFSTPLRNFSFPPSLMWTLTQPPPFHVPLPPKRPPSNPHMRSIPPIIV